MICVCLGTSSSQTQRLQRGERNTLAKQSLWRSLRLLQLRVRVQNQQTVAFTSPPPSLGSPHTMLPAPPVSGSRSSIPVRRSCSSISRSLANPLTHRCHPKNACGGGVCFAYIYNILIYFLWAGGAFDELAWKRRQRRAQGIAGRGAGQDGIGPVCLSNVWVRYSSVPLGPLSSSRGDLLGRKPTYIKANGKILVGFGRQWIPPPENRNCGFSQLAGTLENQLDQKPGRLNYSALCRARGRSPASTLRTRFLSHTPSRPTSTRRRRCGGSSFPPRGGLERPDSGVGGVARSIETQQRGAGLPGRIATFQPAGAFHSFVREPSGAGVLQGRLRSGLHLGRRFRFVPWLVAVVGPQDEEEPGLLGARRLPRTVEPAPGMGAGVRGAGILDRGGGLCPLCEVSPRRGAR
ncbi:hypothetical protein KIL84_019905 [Mauremys mutica]|uniref:Uncharacterized protein n=1 Tax=Mauremys mutica TaxID=74926 RepID=A0A9D4BAQ2_9SAUR|nr:hypothetical protein KIL84_019905 [Mauremys mutica]